MLQLESGNPAHISRASYEALKSYVYNLSHQAALRVFQMPLEII